MAGELSKLAQLRGGLNLNSPRYNPRPAGVIREGGATDAVLGFLRANPKRFFCHYEIKIATGRSKPSIDWALLFLKSQNLIECVPDDARNPLYRRYRAVVV